MGKETEIITQSKKGVFMNPYFPFCIQVGKYSSVLAQQAVYIPDKIV